MSIPSICSKGDLGQKKYKNRRKAVLTPEETEVKSLLNSSNTHSRILQYGSSDFVFEVLWGGNHNLINWLNHSCLLRLKESSSFCKEVDELYIIGTQSIMYARAVFIIFLNVDEELKRIVVSGKTKLFLAAPYNIHSSELFFQELRNVVNNWLKCENLSILSLIDNTRDAYIVL